MSTAAPVHGTAVALDGRGVLITGAAGAGKTTLALTLIRRARAGGLAAGLIADDRVHLAAEAGGLTAACPEPIAGKIEIRGWGVADAAGLAAEPARLALLVRLVPPADALRFAADHGETLCGCALACLRLPQGPTPTAPTAVLAALGLPVWL